MVLPFATGEEGAPMNSQTKSETPNADSAKQNEGNQSVNVLMNCRKKVTRTLETFSYHAPGCTRAPTQSNL